MARKRLRPYHHEQRIARVPGYANSEGGRISENHRGVTVFADPDRCGHAHRPTSVTIPWTTIRAALRRKSRHEG